MSWNIAVKVSAIGTLKCVETWLTNFRGDLPKIEVPTLITHSDADRILSFESRAESLPKLIKGSRLVVIQCGSHVTVWTHAGESILKF